jgi:hypothetical protein
MRNPAINPPCSAPDELADRSPTPSGQNLGKPEVAHTLGSDWVSYRSCGGFPVVSRDLGGLAELFDITGLITLPGGQRKREAIGYFISDRTGAPGKEAVDRMIRDVLLYGLRTER